MAFLCKNLIFLNLLQCSRFPESKLIVPFFPLQTFVCSLSPQSFFGMFPCSLEPPYSPPQCFLQRFLQLLTPTLFSLLEHLSYGVDKVTTNQFSRLRPRECKYEDRYLENFLLPFKSFPFLVEQLHFETQIEGFLSFKTHPYRRHVRSTYATYHPGISCPRYLASLHW